MSTTITGATAHTPIQVEGYESTQEGRTILHPIEGSEGHAVVLRQASPRSGTLVVLFEEHADALACAADVAGPRTLTIADTDRPGIDMEFVLDGQLRVKLDPATLDLWHVEIEYQEIG